MKKVRFYMESHKSGASKILAFISVFFWGISFLFTKMGFKYYKDPVTLAVLRYVFSFFTLIVFIFIKKIKFPHVKDSLMFFISGFSGFTVYMIAFNKAVSTLSSATASILLACSPIITALLSWIFLKERINIYCWISIFISFTGILVLTLWEGVLSFNVGVFWMLFASTALAIYNIIQKKFVERYSASEATTFSLLAGTILIVLYSPKSLLEIPKMNFESFFIILCLSLMASVLASLFWTKSLSLAETTSEIVNFMFLMPFIAAIAGIVFLDEKLTSATIIGGIIILAGIVGFNRFKDMKEIKHIKIR